MPKLIQLCPYHDMLLGLGDDGALYRVTLYREGHGIEGVVVTVIDARPSLPEPRK